MKLFIWVRCSLIVVLSISAMLQAGSVFGAEHLSGQVTIGGAPLAQSTVTLWEASADAPKKVAETKQMMMESLMFADRLIQIRFCTWLQLAAH